MILSLISFGIPLGATMPYEAGRVTLYPACTTELASGNAKYLSFVNEAIIRILPACTCGNMVGAPPVLASTRPPSSAIRASPPPPVNGMVAILTWAVLFNS